MSFAVVLRTQARLALTACRMRGTSLSPQVFLYARAPTSLFLPVSRYSSAAHATDSAVPGPSSGIRTKPPSKVVFIRNLPLDATGSIVIHALKGFGDIEGVTFGENSATSSSRYANIEFSRLEDAVAAVESSKEEPITILGVPVAVNFSYKKPWVQTVPPNQVLFVGGLPGNVTRDSILNLFQDFGPIESINIGPKNADIFAQKFAHVHFTNLDDAVAMLESSKQEPFTMAGIPLRLGYSDRRVHQSRGPSSELFFGRDGIPDTLREVLMPFRNSILRTVFLRESNSRAFTGQGFIKFSDVQTATAVYEDLQKSGDAQRFHIRFASNN